MALKATCIKFDNEQKKFLKATAKAQKHNNVSKVVKRLVDIQMGRHT